MVSGLVLVLPAVSKSTQASVTVTTTLCQCKKVLQVVVRPQQGMARASGSSNCVHMSGLSVTACRKEFDLLPLYKIFHCENFQTFPK